VQRRTKRQFDVVMAWSVDRLGRSLQDLVGFLSEIHALKVDLYLHQQGIDTTTPAGKAMFQMMGVFSEFERAMIQERVRAGLARAKDEGTKLGRPKIAPATEKAIPIRGRLHDRLRADRAAPSWPVFDDEGLAQSLRQPLADQTRGDIAPTPGGAPTIMRTGRVG
jgi:DNA invertase Pin-like site-specific DNA recombinase